MTDTIAQPAGGNHDPILLTLLGPAISEGHVEPILSILAAHGLEAATIGELTDAPEHLAQRWALVEIDPEQPVDEYALRAELLDAAAELKIDIAFQRESRLRRKRRLVAFDMDSTLIQGEVIDELAKLAGVGEQVSKITEAAMRGELVFAESFAKRMALLEGLDAEKVLALRGQIPVSPGAERLMRTLKQMGCYTVILSGGFTFFASYLKERLGMDEFHANELEMVDGKVTGRVIPPIVTGVRKAELLREIAEREGIALEETVAVGDGANDLPMMEIAGLGVAYHAKPVVRAKADHALSAVGLDGVLHLIEVPSVDGMR